MTTAPSPLDPAALVSNKGEREILEAFLDYQRAAVVRKLAGLSEADARRRLVPTVTTLAGLARHLTGVERHWFQVRLAQRRPDQVDPNSRGDEASWVVGEGDSIDSLVADYERVCAQSRDVAAGMALDDASPHPRLGQVSLRWVYVHMIEETARHAGHADILRELTDGTTGDD